MQVTIGPISQIPPGEGRTFIVGTLDIAVFHTRDGHVYATQANCPHRGGPLADGLTDGTHVVCPLHDRIFSLLTGEGVGNECALNVYSVQVSEGQIQLTVDEKVVA